MYGFFGSISFVVSAAGDDMLTGGVAILEADEGKALHGVGKAFTYQSECAFSAFVGRQKS